MADPLAGESEAFADRELLRAFVRGDASSFRTLVARHEALVCSSAARRLRLESGHPKAIDVTRTVFEILSRRPRAVRLKSTLGPWLFEVTRLVCEQVQSGRPAGFWSRLWWKVFRKRSSAGPEVGDDVRARVDPLLDAAVDRLRWVRREVLLLRWQGYGLASMAALLGTSESRVARQMGRGLSQIARRLHRCGVAVTTAELEEIWDGAGRIGAGASAVQECSAANLAWAGGHGAAMGPSRPLVRRVLRTLAWARWRRRVAIGVPAFFLGMALLIGGWWLLDSRDGHSRTLAWFLVWSVKHEAVTVPGLAGPARPWSPEIDRRPPDAGRIREPGELYQMTNVWLAHLAFDRDQWAAMEPRSVDPLPHFLQPDGTVRLRNPGALRGGLAGVLGYDFHWGYGELEFGGRRMTNVAVRVKGNGTFLGSLYGDKRSFKVDLNRFVRGQKLAGADELNFHNLVNDYSNLSDALGYEFFREAGVPAPRTSYVYLSISVGGQWVRRPLGLYALVEPVGKEFAEEHLGSPRTPLFKPVTYELFRDLGNEWTAYEEIYDLRTEATPEQRRRLIEFARLVTAATDAEFGMRLGDYLDLDAFARFLAVQVMLSNYDSLLSTGQNFYLYLDPDSNRFGFIPWDLDLAWGGFFLLGTDREREQASIWHPWVGTNRFLERVFRVDAFRNRYRANLAALLEGRFQPERLNQRIDALAAVVRGPVSAESDFRQRKFEEAVAERQLEAAPGRANQGANRPTHQLKRFVINRAKSVRKQLNGESEGIILQRRPK